MIDSQTAERIQIIVQLDGSWSWSVDGIKSTRSHPTRRTAWKAAKSAAKKIKLPD